VDAGVALALGLSPGLSGGAHGRESTDATCLCIQYSKIVHQDMHL
jgi:hypothetical protein